jgi:hypothetical protein
VKISTPPPAWLADFQRTFGAVIRTPLDRATGTLRAATETYPGSLDARERSPGEGRARLAVYNRQYWFRLFGVLQSTFPLTSRLLGYWSFNEHAARFLTAKPPEHWDIERAADGFVAHLEELTAASGGAYAEPPGVWLEGGALVEAARLDAAFRQVFHAVVAPPFRPSPADAPRLLTSRLVLGTHVALVEQRWPLLALRQAAASDGKDAFLPLPPALDAAEHLALVRTATATRHVPLAPLEARLLRLLTTETVGGALAALETACPEEHLAALPALTQAYLAKSVERGFWSALVSEPPA